MLTEPWPRVLTRSTALAERARALRNICFQKNRRFLHDELGYNFRMSDLHAAIGVVQMERLKDFTTQRRANAAYLSANLKGVQLPKVEIGYDHVWHHQ